ncbi:Putative 2-hydroxyacid dehydrogenase [Marinomonas aquimarina]|uniref:Putative 2-hydroxyacid dehydrogenase n=1 Tax=Marinomonas aquimarina TaxID=295068 RepID=A0A1A8TFA8_9GAMM|nr:D-2-hydroxyacid dehydrogenase [Marinomonas aquimarina]SBS31723.1 Putative 2-hydroxyacid dehydrogenase [Marinomonas aquimarina]
MKAVFLDRGSFPEDIKIPMPESVKETQFFHNCNHENVLERIQDADIVMSNKVILSRQTLAQCPNLKLVQVMATGTNNVDLQACQDLGIAVQNVAGYSTVSVPEHTFAMMLELRRNLTRYREAIKQGRWAECEFFGFLDFPLNDLANSTLCLLGKGSLGNRVAEIARAFGMKVIFAEHRGAETVRDGYMDFNEAIKAADVVSLHCPLTDSTRNVIDKDVFALMKPTAIVINTGRGGLVNEEDLVEAIKTERIAGAGFDVATVEPMPMNHVLQSIAHLPNFILTPHVAWASEYSMARLLQIACDNMASFIEQQTQ